MKKVRNILSLNQEPIGRLQYFLLNVTWSLISYCLALFADEEGGGLLNLLIFAFILMTLFALLQATSNRLADIGVNRHYRWLYLLPFINFGLLVFLLLKPTEPKNNND